MNHSSKTAEPGLKIGAANDVAEQEADAMADRIMRMPEQPLVRRKCAHCEEEEQAQRMTQLSFVQRKCAHCEEEEKQIQRLPLPSFIQRKAEMSGGGVASSAVTNQIRSTQGGGSPMPWATRNFMENRFGADFSQVRIHTGSYAEQLSTQLNAQAFTVGRDIYFNQGKFSPGSSAGQHLLAHELTHTIQQGSISRKINRKTDDDELDLLSYTPSSVQIQRQEATMTRAQEIAQSNSTPGEISLSLQPLSISIYNFAIDSYQLKPEHRQLLDEVISLLSHTNAQNWRIDVTGHADASGEPVVNDPLSVRRANEVRRFLRRQLGSRITSHGEGEDMPFDSNETISGRSRNRRVDIVFTSNRNIVRDTEEETPEPQETEEERRRRITIIVRQRRRRPKPTKDPEEDDHRTFCERHPIICGLGGGTIFIPVILCGIFWEACLCLMAPPLCTITPPPPPPPTDLDPDKKGPPDHACVDSVRLPSGDLPMVAQWPILGLLDAFWMSVTFRENLDEGCRCYCGEYQQNVRGFFEIQYNDGHKKQQSKPLRPGVNMTETTFLEDGTGAANSGYGHRANPQTAINTDDETTFDGFFPTQANGCHYIGNDNPGFGSLIAEPDEVRRTISLEFEGGPVDTCLVPGVRTPMRAHWSTWRVRGEIIRPAPPTPTPKPKPSGGSSGNGGGGSGGSGQVVDVTPVPARTTPTSNYPSWYAGGISPIAGVNDTATMRLAFRVDGRSETFLARIPIQVIGANADAITIETTNDTSLNVAPSGVSEVVLAPHKRITITRQILRNSP